MQRDDPEYIVGGGGQGGRHQLETCIQEMEQQLQEMPPTPRRESVYFYTNWSDQSFFNSFVDENLATSKNNCNVDIGDVHDQLRASKFFNLMLMRLWRRRRAEVYGLHTLTHKYKDHTERLQEELSIRDRLLSSERRRTDQLATQLKDALDRISLTSQSSHHSDQGSRLSKSREDKLRAQLMAKSQECEYAAEMLASCKKEMFRELAMFRSCCQESANEQRRAVQLELLNAELETELLALRKQLLTQNDQMVVSVSIKQEELDTTYKTLETCEHDFAILKMKHSQFLRLTDYLIQLGQRHNDASSNMNFIQNVLLVQAKRQFNTLCNCCYHISACVLDYFKPSDSRALCENYRVHICWAMALFLTTSFL